jgi:hypothetical protein
LVLLFLSVPVGVEELFGVSTHVTPKLLALLIGFFLFVQNLIRQCDKILPTFKAHWNAGVAGIWFLPFCGNQTSTSSTSPYYHWNAQSHRLYACWFCWIDREWLN